MQWIRLFFLIFWAFSQARAAPLEFLEGSVLRDAEIEGILHDFSDPILRVASVNPKDVRIYLIASDQMNAFSALGNLIVVNTGLILKVHGAEELIAVLAHEIGHLSGRHVLRTLEALDQAKNTGLLTAALGAVVAAATGRPDALAAGLLGAQHVAERSFLAYSRGQESAADQAAIRYLAQLHWPVQGLMTLMEQFKNQELLSEAREDLYVRTHPLGRDRLVVAEEACRLRSDGKLPFDFAEKFNRMKTKILAYTLPAKQVLQEYKGGPDTLGCSARAIAFYRLGNTVEALKEMNALLALEKNHPNPYSYELKAQILFDRGRIKEAIRDIQKALMLCSSPSPILKTLAAQMMIESTDPSFLKKAVDLLESVKLAEKDNGETWRLLSIAYGKQGDMGKMSLCLAEIALLQGNIPRAKSQCNRALHFLPKSTPASQRAKDILVEIENQK